MRDPDIRLDRHNLSDRLALHIGYVVGILETPAEPQVTDSGVAEFVYCSGFGKSFDVRGVFTCDVGLYSWTAGCERCCADCAGVGFG
jgi:hypothetical protein